MPTYKNRLNRPHNPKVRGSNPLPATKEIFVLNRLEAIRDINLHSLIALTGVLRYIKPYSHIFEYALSLLQTIDLAYQTEESEANLV